MRMEVFELPPFYDGCHQKVLTRCRLPDASSSPLTSSLVIGNYNGTMQRSICIPGFINPVACARVSRIGLSKMTDKPAKTGRSRIPSMRYVRHFLDFTLCIVFRWLAPYNRHRPTHLHGESDIPFATTPTFCQFGHGYDCCYPFLYETPIRHTILIGT